MSGFLAQAVQRDDNKTETLRVVEQVTHAGKVLAVAETSQGALVLVRERTRKVDADGKRDKDGVEVKTMRRTADIADIAHAIESGLLA